MTVFISKLSFEHYRVPLGIGEARPRISWRFGGNPVNWVQSAYDIEISHEGGEPSIYHVNSPDSLYVAWPTDPLQSGASATVRVRAYGQAGQPTTPWSDRVTVEAGLLDKKSWSGAVAIAADRDTEGDGPHRPILFRKKFSVDRPPSSARLYITAFGLYEAEINGTRVGDLVLAPGWPSYKHRQVYDTYDVTELIQMGENVIGATVGEGWYAGRLGWNGGVRNIYGDTLGLLGLLVIARPNGTKQFVPSDATWEANIGPIVKSEIYDGEIYDSRIEYEGWSTAAFNNRDWLAVKELPLLEGSLVPADGPPVRRREERKPEKFLMSPSGKTIVDFGQNVVGWLRLKIEGLSGQKVRMIHTEALEGGEVATRPLRISTATDELILSGKGIQIWEPKFTFHGFRYVQIDGWPTNSTPLDENSLTAVVIHTDMERTGWFECSHPLLNKFHQNVQWSMKGNFVSIPTDCPQRDERLGWTGDACAFAPTANFLYDTSGFWRGWLKDMQSEQFADNACWTPMTVPLGPVDQIFGHKPLAYWGDAVIEIPHEVYLSYGDLVMLQEQYRGSKAWIDQGIPRNESGLWDRSFFQFGDWLDPRAPPEHPEEATTDPALVSDACLVHATGLISKLSSWLGRQDECSSYQSQHGTLKKEFQKAWISADGVVKIQTQTALAMSLYYSLFATPEHADAAVSLLRDTVEKNDFKVGTGIVGTPILGHALTKYSASDFFYRMLLQTRVPSWLYQVVMGGTTTWERWDSMLPDRKLNPGSMTSFNHYALGSVASWIHRVIGGLSPAEPGWKRIAVEPIPGGQLTSAKTRFLSPYGLVSTNWWFECYEDDFIKHRNGFHLIVEVPPNTKADVTLPAGPDGQVQRFEVGSGCHEYFVPGLYAEH
ncbi:uncharacterized protein Z518_07045 [Rhinocladiella mackenziei CBS 650.93]|uniref:alpha-L-rhamnosidase n=1 Tax=Rhinocladiella mackenziei CBS 650.93 TaxID=1442369 RepID=A0A0D2FN72_9EURO|nr:uncharacterized protein Z518_07045 [Rhinocladiella mackenziei CBS 650.93]KIX03492.1 hypothetical protein Z518_07045 [Rhinocladiella mackenziei CBS 650.93]